MNQKLANQVILDPKYHRPIEGWWYRKTTSGERGLYGEELACHVLRGAKGAFDYIGGVTWVKDGSYFDLHNVDIFLTLRNHGIVPIQIKTRFMDRINLLRKKGGDRRNKIPVVFVDFTTNKKDILNSILEEVGLWIEFKGPYKLSKKQLFRRKITIKEKGYDPFVRDWSHKIITLTHKSSFGFKQFVPRTY